MAGSIRRIPASWGGTNLVSKPGSILASAEGEDHALRGGAYNSLPNGLRVSVRFGTRNVIVGLYGFRCARVVNP
jgi:hypothetical protein